MRFWLYKNNLDGGPAGYWGDWESVFRKKGPVRWGGHYSTESPEVWKLLDEVVAVGDVVAAYQTDRRLVVGFLRITAMKPPRNGEGGLEMVLQPIHHLDPPFAIHEHKKGTPLEYSNAVRGPVMMRELERAEMEALVTMSGAPKRVLRGREQSGGWQKVSP